MPALKSLFSKILDATGSTSSPNASKRSFQKIHSHGATVCGPGSHAPSGRSSIGGDYIKRTTEFRISSQLEFEVNQDYELHNGPLPDYLRRSANSWTPGPGLGSEQNSRPPTGGYRHVGNASQPPSIPLISAAAPISGDITVTPRS